MLTEIIKRFRTRIVYLFQLNYGMTTFPGEGYNLSSAKNDACVRALEFMDNQGEEHSDDNNIYMHLI